MLLLALMFAALCSAQGNVLGALSTAEDGWYRWRVPAVIDGEEENIYVRMLAGSTREIEISAQQCNLSFLEKIKSFKRIF